MPESSKMAAVASGADRISDLPDGVLQHILGFLQADEAVRTSVLAPRWRHLWKYMRVLRVMRQVPVQSLLNFLYHLFVLRDRSSLDECLFDFGGAPAEDVRYVNLWVLKVLLCQVQVLSVTVGHRRSGLHSSLAPLVSKRLTKLELYRPTLLDKFLDFSSCPELKYLKMYECCIYAEKISSRSLERLIMVECEFGDDKRTRISAPSLMLLRLIYVSGRTPLFEEMPLLMSARVMLYTDCVDFCDNIDHPGYCGDASCKCYGIDNGSACSVLLRGLSAATHLALISDSEVFILKRDLRLCPTFSKLKTLSLNQWCVAPDHRALACILQHSPILEKLTINVTEEQYITELPKEPGQIVHSPFCSSVKQQFTLEQLKRVEVHCKDVDKRVHNIIKSLISYGIPPEKIGIRQECGHSEYFSFLCTGFSSMKI